MQVYRDLFIFTTPNEDLDGVVSHNFSKAAKNLTFHLLWCNPTTPKPKNTKHQKFLQFYTPLSAEMKITD